MGYYSRISHAFDDAPRLPLTQDSKYILISDCHRGSGNSNDNFIKNQHLYFAALNYYYDLGFTYIELGDGDDLWENRKMEQIIEIYSNIFWKLSLFYQEKRLYLLYGNHDMIKKHKNFIKQKCSSYFCSTTQTMEPLFPNIKFYSGLILQDEKKHKDIYMLHGHQADFANSVLWKLTRFLVRYFWTPLERLGVLDPTSTAKNYIKKNNIEYKLDRWAKRKNQILIAGHTHRPMLNGTHSLYFNTGSCVHPRCITCIEIENRSLTLVKWTVNIRKDMTLFVSRDILEGPLTLDIV